MLPTNCIVPSFVLVLPVKEYVDQGDIKRLQEFLRSLADVVDELYGDDFLAISGNAVSRDVILVFATREASANFRDNWYMARAKILAEDARHQFTDPDLDHPF